MRVAVGLVMATEILCPTRLTHRDPSSIYKLCGDMLQCNDDIIINARQLDFVSPLGLASFGATIGSLPGPCTVEIVNLQPAMQSYLNRMDVFRLHSGVNVIGLGGGTPARHDRKADLVELTCVADPRQIAKVAHRLAVATVGFFPDVNPDEQEDEMTGHNRFSLCAEPLEYALSELLENALTHARRYGNSHATVWVACQHYPSSGQVQIAVVDNGCGILATLASHSRLSAKTDLAAIMAALQPRVSCNRDLGLHSDSVNQGVGLTTTYRIATAAGGWLTIVSGDAHYASNGYGGPLRFLPWKGCAVLLGCHRDKLPDVKYRELLPKIEPGAHPRIRYE